MAKQKGGSQLALFAAPAPPMPDLTTFDWIVINTSSGKDSQAMTDYVCDLAESVGILHRVVSVHADLGRVEWAGTAELAEAQAVRYGIPFIKVWRRQGDLLQHIEARGKFPGPDTRYCTAHHKQNQVSRVFTALTEETRQAHLTPRDGDLLEQIEARGMFPDAKNRYCTSDQKRAQIQRVFTYLANQKAGRTVGERAAQMVAGREDFERVRILNCMGMRAEESPARAKKKPLEMSEPASNGKREVWNWLPLHVWTEEEVWARIRASISADLVHPCYALGMPRCSCVFCIFAPREALVIAGRHNPELLDEYVRVETAIGHKFRVNLSMADVKAAIESGETPKEVSNWKM